MLKLDKYYTKSGLFASAKFTGKHSLYLLNIVAALSALVAFRIRLIEAIMGVKAQRPRCFMDIAIDNVLGKKLRSF